MFNYLRDDALVLALLVSITYRERFPDIFPAFPAVSLIGVALVWIVVEVILATSTKGQTWKVVDGRAIYESCSPLLGRSFDVLGQPTNVEWSPLLACLATFVLCVAVIVWMIAQVAKHAKSAPA